MRLINPNPQDYAEPAQAPPRPGQLGTALTDLYLPSVLNGDRRALAGAVKSLLERDSPRQGP